MMEHVEQLIHDGNWTQLQHLATTLPVGDPLARVHLSLSKHAENESTDGTGYRRALAHARSALAAAVPGGLLHTWALARTAAYCADLGMYKNVESVAIAFMKALPAHPRAEAMAPWVWFALARVKHSQGRFSEAISLWHTTISSSEGELQERARLHLVWTLAEAQRVGEALRELPADVSFVPSGYLEAAKAAVCAAARDWRGAREHALSALCQSSQPVFDSIQIAEVYLILHRAARVLGWHGQAVLWFAKTAAVLSRWNGALMTRLVLTLRVEGGERFDATASHCGPAGHKRIGLRGVLG